MPVFSYLAYPKKGEKQALLKDLTAIEHCEVVPADHVEILLLVTDTPGADAEKTLQEELKRIKSLQSLGMVFGHMDAL